MAFNDIVYRYQLNRSTNRNHAPFSRRYIRTLMKMKSTKTKHSKRHMTKCLSERYDSSWINISWVQYALFITFCRFIYVYHGIWSMFLNQNSIFLTIIILFSVVIWVSMTRFLLTPHYSLKFGVFELISMFSNGV